MSKDKELKKLEQKNFNLHREYIRQLRHTCELEKTSATAWQIKQAHDKVRTLYKKLNTSFLKYTLYPDGEKIEERFDKFWAKIKEKAESVTEGEQNGQQRKTRIY